jgi:hypothetical protein
VCLGNTPHPDAGASGGVAADVVRSRDAGVIANDPGEIALAVRTWLTAECEVGSILILRETVSAGVTRQKQSERFRRLGQTLIRGNRLRMGA